MIWADNVFLAAKNVEEAQTMIDEVTASLSNANLYWKAKEAACMGVGNLKDAEVWVNAWMEDSYQNIPVRTSLNILGSCIDNTACGTTAMLHRKTQAEKTFWSNHKQLMSRDASKLKKLTAWMGICGKSALFDCGGWSLTAPQLSNMRAWENDFLRKMIRMPWTDKGRAIYHIDSSIMLDAI